MTDNEEPQQSENDKINHSTPKVYLTNECQWLCLFAVCLVQISNVIIS